MFEGNKWMRFRYGRPQRHGARRYCRTCLKNRQRRRINCGLSVQCSCTSWRTVWFNCGLVNVRENWEDKVADGPVKFRRSLWLWAKFYYWDVSVVEWPNSESGDDFRDWLEYSPSILQLHVLTRSKNLEPQTLSSLVNEAALLQEALDDTGRRIGKCVAEQASLNNNGWWMPYKKKRWARFATFVTTKQKFLILLDYLAHQKNIEM